MGGFMIKTFIVGLFLTALISPTLTLAVEDAGAQIPYHDEDFSCLTNAEADRYVKDFNINVASFGGKELCDAAIDTKKLFNDIKIVEGGQFKAGENNLIKGFVEGSKYYSWLISQTRGVERGNDVPWATAYNSGGYFTMQDGWAQLSALGRVGTFIHEARHTEGYGHIPCTQGPYQGVSLEGCDRNYNYGGSHAVEMEYYARVSVQGTNFHPVFKKMARLMAMARSNFVFNTAVMQPREAVLTLSQDGKSSALFDNGKWYSREVPAIDGRLKRTSFGAVIFDGVRAMAIELYQNSGFSDLVADTYSYYKLVSETSNVKDFEEFDSGVKRHVVKISNDNKIAAFNFPKGSWGTEQSLPFQVAKVMTAIPGVVKSGLYLLADDGQIYNYVPETQRLVLQNAAWDFTNKEVVNFKNQNLILRNDGKIYVQTGSTLQPWSEANGTYSGLVTVPVYDAFNVVKE